VSGSGKSTLIEDILHRSLARSFYRARVIPGRHGSLTGIEHLDKVIDIDQSAIGRTPRSNPATYTGLFAPIRDLFPPDTVLDVEITPNRGDLLSHFGLAREIAALTNKPVRLPSTSAGGAPALQFPSLIAQSAQREVDA